MYIYNSVSLLRLAIFLSLLLGGVLSISHRNAYSKSTVDDGGGTCKQEVEIDYSENGNISAKYSSLTSSVWRPSIVAYSYQGCDAGGPGSTSCAVYGCAGEPSGCSVSCSDSGYACCSCATLFSSTSCTCVGGGGGGGECDENPAPGCISVE